MTRGGIRYSFSDRVFGVANFCFLTLIIAAMTYPFVYVLSTSFSETRALMRNGNVMLLPRGFSLDAYRFILTNSSMLRYYYNSVIYAVSSTAFMLTVTSLMAYALSVKHFSGRKVITILMAITMFFGGGLIPYYLVIKWLGLIDRRWVMIIPAGINVWNIIIFRTFFQQLPVSLSESAHMDGASDYTILFRIVLPLSSPLVATFAIFGLVGSWNDFFTPLLFINDTRLLPVQMLLRKILVNLDMGSISSVQQVQSLVDTRVVKSAAIVVTMAPIVMVYPFFQKHFTKGVLIGAIKG